MNNKVLPVIVLLLVVAAFMGGMTFANKKNNTGLDKGQPTPAQTAQAPTPVPFNPTKSDKPEVKFFVMSFCPYGNIAEAGLEPVYQLLKSKVDLQPKYIVSSVTQATVDQCKQNCPQRVGNDAARKQCQDAIDNKQINVDVDTCVKQYFPYKDANACIAKECNILKVGTWDSLHGVQELNQNVREICALKQGDSDKWWKFVSGVNTKCNAQNADTCWKDIATAVGYDTNKLSQCAKSEVDTLLKADLAETEKYQAFSSPTVVINGAVYNGGRSPEEYKQAICKAFNNAPEECKTVLSSGQAGGSAAAANCN